MVPSVLLIMMLSTPAYAGFCNYSCQKDTVPGVRTMTRRPDRPDGRKLRMLQIYLSTFSARYDRFDVGDVPGDDPYQEFFELTEKIINLLSENPGLISSIPLGQLTGFIQRSSLDPKLFSSIETMFTALERDLLTYLERRGLGRMAWGQPADFSGWKQALKTANDLLLLLNMHRQFVERHDDGGLMDIMEDFQARVMKAVVSGCELIYSESPDELEQFIRENSEIHSRTGEGADEEGEMTVETSQPLFEPIYGRFGLVGSVVFGFVQSRHKSQGQPG